MNINCIICSDLINPSESIYFTKCGHVFHHHCLSQWMERSKTCPQCRNRVTDKCIFRIYFNFTNSDSIVDDAATLQSKLDNCQYQLRQRDIEMKEDRDKLDSLNTKLHKTEDMLKNTEKKLVNKESALTAMKEQLEYIKIQSRTAEALKEENTKLLKNLNTLNGLQTVLNATTEEAERMMEGYTDVKTVVVFATALKIALKDAESKKSSYRDQVHALKSELNSEKEKVAELQTKIRHLEEKMSTYRRHLVRMVKEKKAKRKSDDLENISESRSKMRKSDGSQNDVTVDDHDVSDAQPPALAETHEPSTSSNVSIETLVKNIHESESPYLSLKQGSVAVAALRHRDAAFKPSEFSIFNGARSRSLLTTALKNAAGSPNKSQDFSIFSVKQLDRSSDMFEEMEAESSRRQTYYDGLGGHSKVDVFPVPIPKLPKSTVKSCVPKLTAKHKLKKPSPAGSQDIGKLLQRLNEK